MKMVAMTLIGCLLLSACSSSPTPLRYYLLHDPMMPNTQASMSKSVMWESVSLPDYLQQPNLCTLTTATELHYATQHFWAEPVAKGIKQSLADAFAQHHQRQILPFTADTSTLRIKLVIEDFVSTFNGEVILRGYYHLSDHNSDSLTKNFHLREPLTADGFSSAVVAMRNTLAKLSEILESDLTTMEQR